MIIRSVSETIETEREVTCPNGGFVSLRLLLAKDGMGFSMHMTTIPVGPPQRWHYKNHMEACYCISGRGTIVDVKSGRRSDVWPGTVYALNENDEHTFQAIVETTLLCIFNPPLLGREVHGDDGSYSAEGDQRVC